MVRVIYYFPWGTSAGYNQNRLLNQPFICKHIKWPWEPLGLQEGDIWRENLLLRKDKAGVCLLASGLGGLSHPGNCLVSGGSWLLSCDSMVWCLSSVLSPLGAGTLTALQEERSLHMQLQPLLSLLLLFSPTASVSLPCLPDNAPLFIYCLGRRPLLHGERWKPGL